MAQESCNLDKDEAEILKPTTSPPPPPPSSSSPSPSSPPPQTTTPSPPPPSLFLKPSQEFQSQRPEGPAESPAATPSPPASRSNSNEGSPSSPAAARFGNRCSSCRKKVGLTGFRCRCGDLFCGRHRYSDTHDCSFDYKAAGREEISKANPVIRAAKIIKI